FIKAEILMQTGNFSEAIKSYRRIRNSENNNDLLIEISGTYQFPDSQLAYKIGKCLFKLNKIAEAEKEFRKGLSFNPREIACILGLANIEFIRNNYNAAKMLLIQALSIEPENSEIKKHLQQTEKAIADKSKKVNKERPLISLAMIVKNEEKYLYDCLKSTVAVVDEIIIVDTGSTDKTKDIARSFNAKIFNFKWNDDFSSARNEALKHCSGEWILYLDADERLEKKTSKYIRTLVQNAGDNTGGFVCTIESEHVTTDGSTEMHRGAYPRIFRNYGYPRISFCGRVHEQISPSIIALGKSIKTSDIIITHLGYNQNSEMMKSKIQRNYSLLMKLVKEEPENAYAWYQLGQTLSHLSLKDEAEGVIRFAIESGKLSDSVYSSAASALAQFEGNRGNFKNALHWAEKSLEKAPNQVYAAYLKACSLLYLKRNAEAVAVFQKLLSRINAEKIVPQSGFDIDISKDEILKKLKEVRKYLNYPFTAE
ncbi:MAG: glycosyltransferase, partial [Bacteroidota bacterium]